MVMRENVTATITMTGREMTMGIGIGIITAIKAVTGGQDKLGVYFYLSKEPAAVHLHW